MFWKLYPLCITLFFLSCVAQKAMDDPCIKFYKEVPDKACSSNDECVMDDPCFMGICAFNGSGGGYCYGVPSPNCPTCDDQNACTDDFMAHMYLQTGEEARFCWRWACIHTPKPANTCRKGK